MLQGLGLSSQPLPSPYDPNNWPELGALFNTTFKTKTRDEWTEIFEKLKDACVAPVLEVDEVMSHEHHKLRTTMSKGNPQPCPRLDRTPGRINDGEKKNLPAGGHTIQILSEMGYSAQQIKELATTGAVKDRSSRL